MDEPEAMVINNTNNTGVPPTPNPTPSPVSTPAPAATAPATAAPNPTPVAAPTDTPIPSLTPADGGMLMGNGSETPIGGGMGNMPGVQPQGKTMKEKLLTVLLILIILGALGFIAYYFLVIFPKSDESSNKNDNITTESLPESNPSDTKTSTSSGTKTNTGSKTDTETNTATDNTASTLTKTCGNAAAKASFKIQSGWTCEIKSDNATGVIGLVVKTNTVSKLLFTLGNLGRGGLCDGSQEDGVNTCTTKDFYTNSRIVLKTSSENQEVFGTTKKQPSPNTGMIWLSITSTKNSSTKNLTADEVKLIKAVADTIEIY